MKKIFYFLTLTVLVVSSCDGFLNREPESDLTPEQYMTTEANVASYATDLYNLLPVHGAYGYGTFENDKHTDNMAYYQPSDIYAPGYWKVSQTGGDYSFSSIYRCNWFFDNVLPLLEDGKITPETTVEGNGGIYMMHGRPMKDHNWHKGGYGTLTVSQVLEQSSNIGVSRIIDDLYHDHPEKYVQGLYNLGVGIPLGMPMGANPRVRMPNTDKIKGNWSKTALAWMSIGYETQIPPISTVAFYNAIANNGRFVRPRFVKAEMVNGQVVREFPVEVIKEKICSDHTLRDIRMILEKVVSEGLGKKAGNKRFKVSGKTGTAQVAENGSYASHAYMVSFCGYFPSDDPKYSCIVCIRKRGLPASGGGQCGPVIIEISQLVMNQGVYRNAREAADSTSIFTPDLTRERTEVRSGVVPDVTGMGVRDAVYALGQAGMKVRLRGTGRVHEQSIPGGTRDAKGKTVTLNLK